ncbi:MAG: hypothetical protein FJ146_03370 [Deltaproteobacteria bacterium]|nr:hypothetical protein [Deltaproteobacteria bacterium]
MSRILDFTYSPEEAVVSRVLILVHRAVDDYLPYAQEASRQFTKTVFSSESDATGIVRVLGLDEIPPPPAPVAVLLPPPPPPPRQARSSDSEASTAREIPTPGPGVQTKAPISGAAKSSSKPRPVSKSKPKSTTTAMYDGGQLDSVIVRPDWISRTTAVILIIGIMALIYVLMI